MALQIAETAYEQFNAERIKAEDLKSLKLLDDKLKELGI
jgi:hypothetical protein